MFPALIRVWMGTLREKLRGACEPQTFETAHRIVSGPGISDHRFYSGARALPSNQLRKAFLKPQPSCLPHSPAFHPRPQPAGSGHPRPRLAVASVFAYPFPDPGAHSGQAFYLSNQRLTGSPDEGVINGLDNEMEMQCILHQVLRVSPL